MLLAVNNLNGASEYSSTWKHVKDSPSRIVSPSPMIRCLRSPSISAWCAHVTVQPDSSRISVFMNGKWNGSNVLMPAGGHMAVPGAASTCSGNSAKWKYAQKKATKNITSLEMNSVMP